MMAHALTEAQVHSIILAPVDGLVTAQTVQHRLPGCGKIGGQGTNQVDVAEVHVASGRKSGTGASITGAICRVAAIYDFLVNVDCFVLMQTENVGVFGLKHRVVVNSPRITDVEFLGYRVPEVRVHQAANAPIRSSR